MATQQNHEHYSGEHYRVMGEREARREQAGRVCPVDVELPRFVWHRRRAESWIDERIVWTDTLMNEWEWFDDCHEGRIAADRWKREQEKRS
jgi:hypothetical protein